MDLASKVEYWANTLKMKETEGSCKKRRKKMADEAHDDSVLLSQGNVTVQPSSGMVTLSEAACALNALEHDATEIQNQIKCSSAPKGPLQVPDSASFKPLSEHDSVKVQNQIECYRAPKGPLQVPTAAAEVMVTNGTQGGAASNHNLSNDDEEKAESSSKDPVLINVEGYFVKKEVAPMLRRIFDKHKDIARDCKINDRTILVPILEMICSFCQKLENLSLNIMDTELEDMTLIVENFRLMGFDMKWLSERIKDIPKVKQLVKDSLALQEDITKIEIKEKQVEKQVGILKQKLSSAEAVLEMMKAEKDKARREFKQRRMALKLEGFLCKQQCKADSYYLSLV